MPMGIVSDEDFHAEITSLSAPKKSSPAITGEVLPKETPGRKEGDTNIPDSLRKVIGETSVIEGRKEALKIARMFDVSPSQVSAYANGATSTATYDTPVKSLIGHINKSRRKAIKRAELKLNGALEAITQDKLDYADPKDLSTIAKDMSVIIKNLEPPVAPTTGDEGKGPQFVIFAPQFKDERTYETINLNEA
jgi:predicted transcriptional regulator